MQFYHTVSNLCEVRCNIKLHQRMYGYFRCCKLKKCAWFPANHYFFKKRVLYLDDFPVTAPLLHWVLRRFDVTMMTFKTDSSATTFDNSSRWDWFMILKQTVSLNVEGEGVQVIPQHLVYDALYWHVDTEKGFVCNVHIAYVLYDERTIQRQLHIYTGLVCLFVFLFGFASFLFKWGHLYNSYCTMIHENTDISS